MPSVQVPPPYIYTPLVTYLNEEESIDLESLKKHIHHVVIGGIGGLVREAGATVRLLTCSTQSHKKSLHRLRVDPSIQRARNTSMFYLTEAKQAGADYALVLPPTYWITLMTPEGLESSYCDVADASPMPILIYNYPRVVGELNIKAATVIHLGKKHANIAGVKLTLGNAGKLNRIQSTFIPNELATFAGNSDFLLPAMVSEAHRGFVGLANVFLWCHAKLLDDYRNGHLSTAQKLQVMVST